ncbi:MAG: hypothetical protein ACKVXR_17160 [Planctomycetota bacterium]
MKLTGIRLWLTVFSLLAVLLVAVVDTDRTSPGPISSVHGRIEALQGRGGCADCHGGWFSDMKSSCLECHEPIAEQLEVRKGLHGILEPALASTCGTCHGEHHGETFSIVNERSFAAAGVPDPKVFDHRLIGFAMSGRHEEIGCVECHESANVPVLSEGEHRFLGLDQDCESCHVDVHEGRMQVACASCHGQSTWDELHSFGHERQLPLVGGHGDVDCRTCHADGDTHSLEMLGESPNPPAARRCADCHESPHAAEFARGAAALAGYSSEAGCVACHVAEHTDFGEGATAMTAAGHSASGFKLDPPHDEADCQSCHDANLAAFRARYPGRSSEGCSVCHEDPHGGQFETGLFAHQECTACHDRERFEPHAFTVEKHELVAMRLTGVHIDTSCEECHTLPAPEAPRTFHGTPSRCEECHEDAHAGFFREVAAAMPPDPTGECGRCHTTSSFSEIPPPGFDHAMWTSFAVVGAHAETSCASCHVVRKEPDGAGRTFGRIEEEHGPFEGCHTCHSDPHQGAFDLEHLPAAVAGRTDCARCHSETSFRFFPDGFDHGAWTGFALVEDHAAAACSACHAPLGSPDDAGRTWEHANGANCSDCHIDPHAGQFDRPDGALKSAKTDCARCHEPGAERYLEFDHERDARFALGEQHGSLECSACHQSYADQDGFGVVRYRPLGIECVDCHGVQEDVLMRRKRREK